MKFPSLETVGKNFVSVLKRFPVASAISFVIAFVIIYLNEGSYSGDTEDLLISFLLSGGFVFPLALAIEVFAEEMKWDVAKRNGLRIGVFLVLILSNYTFFIDHPNWGNVQWIKFWISEMLSVSVFLGLPFLYSAKNASRAFWSYSMEVIESFARAFLLFLLLFIGLALLIVSTEYLFDLRIDDEIFLNAWAVVTFVLGVPFFMFGIPQKVRQLEAKKTATKGLVILTKYFLVPLVLLYMVLLYVYGGSIAVNGEWPKEGVAGWIIGFSLAGIVAYFFAEFIEEKYHSYLQYFRKAYFWVLLPLVFLLFAAVWTRVADYGITEPRYFGLAFGTWMLMLSCYYMVSRVKDLRFIVVSLAVVMFVAAFGGPISAFGVSERSQVDRLEFYLEKAGMLVDGKIVPVSDENEVGVLYLNEIRSIVRYVVTTHGVAAIDDWFEQDLVAEFGRVGSYDARSTVFEYMGLEDSYYDSSYYSERRYVDFDGKATDSGAVEVGGYDYAAFVGYSYKNSPGAWNVEIGYDSSNFTLQYGSKTVLEGSLVDALTQAVGNNVNAAQVDIDYEIDFETDDVVGVLRLDNANAYFLNAEFESLSSAEWIILYNEK